MNPVLPCHVMVLRNAIMLMPCTAMLHIIISGTASIGGIACSRIAPATAENAKPANPDTTAPANTPAESSRYGSNSGMVSGSSDGVMREVGGY